MGTSVGGRAGYGDGVTIRDGRVAWLARALTVAATTLATSAGAHAVAGGHLVPPALLGALGPVLVVAALPLTRTRLRTPSLLVWAGSAQLALHLALSWLHPTAGTTVTVVGHHGLQTAATASTGATGAALPMLLAHLLGTALAVALAVAADRAAAFTRAWWLGTVRTVTSHPLSPGRPAPPVPPTGPRPAPRFLEHALARRGPPTPRLA